MQAYKISCKFNMKYAMYACINFLGLYPFPRYIPASISIYSLISMRPRNAETYGLYIYPASSQRTLEMQRHTAHLTASSQCTLEMQRHTANHITFSTLTHIPV